MRAQEFVTELFQPGKKWQWRFRGSEEASAEFNIGDIEYQFYAYTHPSTPGVWEVEFKIANADKHSTKFGLTGTGNAAEVMSTVTDIMREFLQQHRIESLVFTAAEPSRQALYKRMISRLLPTWGIHTSDAGNGEKMFVVTSPEQDITEDTTQPGSAGCIIVAEDTGRWCLQQRSDTVSDPGVWSTWGGGVEPGETLEQAVRRELAEEGGYTGPIELEHLHQTPKYATFIARVPKEFEPKINHECKDWCWVEADQLPNPLHPGLTEALSKLNEEHSHQSYKEIEFVCVNPQFPDATDPALQKKMYLGLKQIPGVIPLWQEWGDYSEGQVSLSAIYKDKKQRTMILSLAKQLGVQIDLEQPVNDSYVDRAIQGEHEGQITENFNDGKKPGRKGLAKRVGVNCKQSVSKLRSIAKNSSGERQRMAHWCANMKSGRNK